MKLAEFIQSNTQKAGGEAFQLEFAKPGGFVVVQPYEEGGAAPSK